MNDDLLMALKQLLKNGVAPSLASSFDDNDALLQLPKQPVRTYVKLASNHSVRVLHPEELGQFSEDGLRYFHSLEKMNLLSNESHEQLLDIILSDTPAGISPNKIKWALLSMATADISPFEYAFLDFILTPNLSAKH